MRNIFSLFLCLLMVTSCHSFHPHHDKIVSSFPNTSHTLTHNLHLPIDMKEELFSDLSSLNKESSVAEDSMKLMAYGIQDFSYKLTTNINDSLSAKERTYADIAALDILIALDKDIALMQPSDEAPALRVEHQWNISCGEAYQYIVNRGCYGRKIFFHDKLIGCHAGRMPNTPVEHQCY